MVWAGKDHCNRRHDAHEGRTLRRQDDEEHGRPRVKLDFVRHMLHCDRMSLVYSRQSTEQSSAASHWTNFTQECSSRWAGLAAYQRGYVLQGQVPQVYLAAVVGDRCMADHGVDILAATEAQAGERLHISGPLLEVVPGTENWSGIVDPCVGCIGRGYGHRRCGLVSRRLLKSISHCQT